MGKFIPIGPGTAMVVLVGGVLLAMPSDWS